MKPELFFVVSFLSATFAERNRLCRQRLENKNRESNWLPATLTIIETAEDVAESACHPALLEFQSQMRPRKVLVAKLDHNMLDVEMGINATCCVAISLIGLLWLASTTVDFSTKHRCC
jgi:hypothetical protein